MKIYVGHSTNYDYVNELYKPILKSDLVKEHEFIFPHLNNNFNSNEVINNSDLFIAEISYPTLGLGIEIGRAETNNQKILCIYKDGVKISSSLKYVNVDLLSYLDEKDLVDKIGNYISKKSISKK
ncbi:MAG: hypothetical protein IJ068_03700 [Bacilli bacterium]|nr:hypothetical protein [Bacilli bacterium]